MQSVDLPLQANVINKVFQYGRKKKFELLLLSFMLLIFGGTFSNRVHLTGIIDIYQNMITGALVFYARKRLRYTFLTLIALSVTLTVFESKLDFIDLRSWQGIIYLVFFFLVAIEVFKVVLYSKSVSRELLSASLCGFVLLCLIGTFLFYQIDVELPHSFSNTGQGEAILTNLNYFSFTTMLTIGYGDITPMTLVAKRAVMLMGLTGHFYTVFITSIIVGKYLSVKRAHQIQ
jgi:voltage-gated potassium channel